MDLEDHLRVGSVALLFQDHGKEAGTKTHIRCARPDHCGRSLLPPESVETPVIVLSSSSTGHFEKDEMCLVALVTSDNQTSLKKFAESTEEIPCGRCLIPIEHGNPRNGMEMLRLSHGKLIQSYVVADHIWEVPSSMLGNYNTLDGNFISPRLQEFSYYFLMQKLNMVPQKYDPEPTIQLESFPFPGPDLTPTTKPTQRPLRYEYATIRHGYNYENVHHEDIHQYMIVHPGVINLAELQAARPPRHVSNLISFPALPPTPSRSPVNLHTSACGNQCDENSALLPVPAVSGSRRRGEVDWRQVWLGFLTGILVLGWVLFLNLFQGSLRVGDLWAGSVGG